MAASKITIREFQPDDFEDVDAIRRAAFAPVFESFRSLAGAGVAEVAFADAELGQHKHLEEICSASADSTVYVAILDSEIVGFMNVGLNHENALGEIGLNAVDPAHEGNGFGTELYKFALEVMRKAGMKAATVGTGADESHAPARAAYRKAGFDRAVPGVHLYRTL